MGPYSPCVIAGNLVFCSGQLGVTDMCDENITKQTRTALMRVQQVLSTVGFSLENVVKVEVYLKNMDDFMTMNDVYASFFSGSVLPARVTVEVARLPKGALVEIACVAFKA